MFANASEYHLSFRLRCDQREQLAFSDDLRFHLLELPKFNLPDNNVTTATPLEKWLFFLKHAASIEADRLASQLVNSEYLEATGVLEMISESPEERDYYESRRKVFHDMEYLLAAEREKGHEEGLAEGREEGREEGSNKGILIGKIQLIQQLLGDDVATKVLLWPDSMEQLEQRLDELQERLRSRGE